MIPLVIKCRIFIALILCLLLISCNLKSSNSNQGRVKKIDLVSEDFNVFFNRFNADSVFQYSRIVFPLKLIIPDQEDDNSITKLLSRKEYKYFDLTKYENEKSIIKKTRLSSAKIKVHYSVEETGIGLDYYFINKKGLWWLIFFEDYSD